MLLESQDDTTGCGEALHVFLNISFVQISPNFVIWETYSKTFGVSFTNSYETKNIIEH